MERLLVLMAPAPWHRLLDVATGPGHTAMAFAPRVAEVVGLDLTPAMAAAFSREAAERGVRNARFVLGDAHNLPFSDASFDLVTCRRAAHHFVHVPAVLSEMGRVLKVGGRLGLADMTTPDEPAAATLFNDLERLRDASHQRAYAPRRWLEWCQREGLRVRRWEVDEERIALVDWLHPVPADRTMLRRLEERWAREPDAIVRQVLLQERGRWWLRKRRLVLVAERVESRTASRP